jgi:hypothetical protein
LVSLSACRRPTTSQMGEKLTRSRLVIT